MVWRLEMEYRSEVVSAKRHEMRASKGMVKREKQWRDCQIAQLVVVRILRRAALLVAEVDTELTLTRVRLACMSH